MSFDKAGDFLLIAAKKYKLQRQVGASIVKQRIREIFKTEYAEFVELWDPKKLEYGILTIAAKNSTASAELFLRTHEILELLTTHEFPEKVKEIRIVRAQEKEDSF